MTIAATLAPRIPEWLLVKVVGWLYVRYEPELRELDRICPAGGTAVDVGAWYGPWSRRLARRCDRVVAFEPVPHLARVLARTMPRQVEVVAAAVADRAGQAELWLPDPVSSDPAATVGTRGISSLRRRSPHTRSVLVPTCTIDEAGLTGVTFMKIDVEGYEVAVLHGAEQTIRRDRPALLIEVESRIQPVGDVVGLVESWGYRGWVLPHRGWIPLADFDLVAHQQRTSRVAERGLLSRSIWTWPRYVNSVLFLPDGQQPDSRTDRPG